MKKKMRGRRKIRIKRNKRRGKSARKHPKLKPTLKNKDDTIKGVAESELVDASSETSTFMSIIEQVEIKNMFFQSMSESLKRECPKIKDVDSAFTFFGDLLNVVQNLPAEASVATQSHSHADEKINVKSLINRNDTLEEKIQTMEQNISSLQKELSEKENGTYLTKTMVETADLKKENNKLEEEINIHEEKYKNLCELIKKKEDVRKNLMAKMWEIVAKRSSSLEDCEKCKKLMKIAKELNAKLASSKKTIADLELHKEELDKMEECFKKQARELEKEVKELKHKLNMEKLLMSDNYADRMALLEYYFSATCESEDPSRKSSFQTANGESNSKERKNKKEPESNFEERDSHSFSVRKRKKRSNRLPVVKSLLNQTTIKDIFLRVNKYSALKRIMRKRFLLKKSRMPCCSSHVYFWY